MIELSTNKTETNLESSRNKVTEENRLQFIVDAIVALVNFIFGETKLFENLNVETLPKLNSKVNIAEKPSLSTYTELEDEISKAETDTMLAVTSQGKKVVVIRKTDETDTTFYFLSENGDFFRKITANASWNKNCSFAYGKCANLAQAWDFVKLL